jgi:hypothetical protein
MSYKKRDDQGTELLIWGIPKLVKKNFKLACIRRNHSMKSVIIKFMRDYINDTREIIKSEKHTQ